MQAASVTYNWVPEMVAALGTREVVRETATRLPFRATAAPADEAPVSDEYIWEPRSR